jgi:hypothetical protein
VLRHKESKEGILFNLKEERTSSSSKWKNNPTTKIRGGVLSSREVEAIRFMGSYNHRQAI